MMGEIIADSRATSPGFRTESLPGSTIFATASASTQQFFRLRLGADRHRHVLKLIKGLTSLVLNPVCARVGAAGALLQKRFLVSRGRLGSQSDRSMLPLSASVVSRK